MSRETRNRDRHDHPEQVPINDKVCKGANGHLLDYTIVQISLPFDQALIAATVHCGFERK